MTSILIPDRILPRISNHGDFRKLTMHEFWTSPRSCYSLFSSSGRLRLFLFLFLVMLKWVLFYFLNTHPHEAEIAAKFSVKVVHFFLLTLFRLRFFRHWLARVGTFSSSSTVVGLAWVDRFCRISLFLPPLSPAQAPEIKFNSAKLLSSPPNDKNLDGRDPQSRFGTVYQLPKKTTSPN